MTILIVSRYDPTVWSKNVARNVHFTLLPYWPLCMLFSINHAYTPSGVVHPSITCDVCGQDQVVHGMRWKCARCYDYDLCTPCYMSGKHSVEHEFVRYDSVGNRYVEPFAWIDMLNCLTLLSLERCYEYIRASVEWIIFCRRYRTRIQQRSNAELLEVKGIFPGAEVVQQPDWQLDGSKGEK